MFFFSIMLDELSVMNFSSFLFFVFLFHKRNMISILLIIKGTKWKLINLFFVRYKHMIFTHNYHHHRKLLFTSSRITLREWRKKRKQWIFYLTNDTHKDKIIIFIKREYMTIIKMNNNHVFVSLFLSLFFF